jgi:hypothetical protein
VPLVFVVGLFSDWHVLLWIDNGTSREVTVSADVNTLATVGPGERARVELPRKHVRLSISGDPEEDLDPRDHPGVWILNVSRAHCFELRDNDYNRSGRSFGVQPGSQRYRDHLFRIEARWVFEEAPASIVTDRATDLIDVPERFASFNAIPCDP